MVNINLNSMRPLLFLLVALNTASALAMEVNKAAPRVQAGEQIYRAKKSVIIEKDCPAVWSIVTDFSGIDKWYSGFSSSIRVDGPANNVGEVRKLVRKGSGQIVHEKMIYMDSNNLELGYTHTLNPPVPNSIALVSLMPLSQGQCQVTWANTFNLYAGQNGSEMTGRLQQAYRTVLDDLKRYAEK